MATSRSVATAVPAALRTRPLQPPVFPLRQAFPASSTTAWTCARFLSRFCRTEAEAAPLPSRPPSSRRSAAAASPLLLRPLRRRYHSADHPPPPGPFGPTENAILAAAYAHVPQHGFSDRSLALGARDAGYPDVTAAAALPDGTFALVRWHLLTRRELLESRARELFGADPATPSDVNERAERLAWERLLANGPIIGRWQEALAIMAQPSCAPEAFKELARLADDIWFLAGDVAVDPSWYAKRAALSATYAASELFMTNDRSPEFCETREFLRRRFAESAEVGGAVRSVGQWLGFTARAGVNVLRSKGVGI